MARTTNEFGGGEIVPAIEAITGVQAPVMEDFVAVPFGTVNHEHGERRQIQNLVNNLKSSSGIERISFDGIDELDTEQGPNGEVVHALNTGDSRIRFVGSGWTFRVNNDGSRPSTDNTGDYIEVTFYGTGFNLLGRIDPNSTWTANLDGGADFVVLDDGSGSAPSDLSSVLNGQNVDANEIIPVTSGLTAGVHTIRIRRETDQLFLTGCEIINENAAITQQPGADFDGRVEALAGTSFPIKPDNSTVPSVDGRDLNGTAATYGTHSTGARVLNYLTSGGQYKQSFNLADEAPGAAAASTTAYTIQLNLNGTSSVTIPAGISSIQMFAYGTGGAGGGGAAATGGANRRSGGGGGGAGLAIAAFTRDSGNTSAETFAITIPTAPTGGAGIVGPVGTANPVIITSGGTDIITANGGGAGQSAPSINASGNGGSGGGATIGSLANWTTGSTATGTGDDGTAGINAGDGGSGGNVAGFGVSPLVNDEGQGFAGSTGSGLNGMVPGGGGSGGGSSTSSISNGAESSGGNGTAGRVYIIATSASSTLTDTDFGITAGELTDMTTTTGVDVGAPTAVFGNQAFDTNRLNQEVIRRINFREFGANNNFAGIVGGYNSVAFTLDDGTTTLVQNNGELGGPGGGVDEYLSVGSSGNNRTITFTFVGTGLDVFWRLAGSNIQDIPVTVDGLSIGNINADAGIVTEFSGIIPIVSGLAYGTHVVTFSNNGVTLINNQGPRDFIIYGPKRPEVPADDAGSLELSDYNIMADYVPVSTVDTNNAGGILSGGTGILRKAQPREVLYAGSIDAFSFSTAHMNGIDAALNSGGSASYTFFGTGVDIRFALDGGLASDPSFLSIDIDGITDFSDTSVFTTSYYFTSAIDIGTGAAETDFNRSTGVVTNRNTNAGTNGGSGVSINGFPIGVHTVTITRTGGRDCHFSAFDIITPIHFQEDTLKVGSEGLNNLTVDPVVEEDEAQVQNLGEAKAWINYDPVNNRVLSSFNIAAVIENVSNNEELIYFDKPFKDANYVALGSVLGTSPGGNGFIFTNGFKQANFCRIQTASTADTNGIFAAFYGELIDE